MKKAALRKGSGNVYKDLGFPNAEEMQAKAMLASRIIFITKKRKLTQKKAAELLDIPQSKVSLLNRGQFSGFSLGRLIKLLNKLSQDVEIVIKSKPVSKHFGHVNVVYL